MLNDFLVLGLVPGTNFQITFSEMAATACILYLMHKYIQYAIEIERWYRLTVHRAGVYYRRQKRHFISVIRYKRYRLKLFERRLIRLAKSYLRRQRHAFYMAGVYRPFSSFKRRYYIKLVQLVRIERRVRRSRTVRTFINLKDLVSQSG
jgi:hypothetical protein